MLFRFGVRGGARVFKTALRWLVAKRIDSMYTFCTWSSTLLRQRPWVFEAWVPEASLCARRLHRKTHQREFISRPAVSGDPGSDGRGDVTSLKVFVTRLVVDKTCREVGFVMVWNWSWISLDEANNLFTEYFFPVFPSGIKGPREVWRERRNLLIITRSLLHSVARALKSLRVIDRVASANHRRTILCSR